VRNRSRRSLTNVVSRLAELDREANIAQRWQAAWREAAKPWQSKFWQGPLPRLDVLQALKQSGRREGSHLQPPADSRSRSFLQDQTIPNACEQSSHDHGNASACQRNGHAGPIWRRHGDSHGDSHAPGGEHGPMPRTMRTTSSSGSLGWKVGGTCSFPRKRRYLTRALKANLTTPRDSNMLDA